MTRIVTIAPPVPDPTTAQRRVWGAVVNHQRQHGCSPSYREIAQRCGRSSAPAIRRIVIDLTRLGVLERLPRRQCAIRVCVWPRYWRVESGEILPMS